MNIRKSHYSTAVAAVIAQLAAGRILEAYNQLDHEDTTVGPYSEALDRGVRFAVIGWRGKREQRETRSAQDAAQSFVDRVGTTRAREAAQRAAKRAQV